MIDTVRSAIADHVEAGYVAEGATPFDIEWEAHDEAGNGGAGVRVRLIDADDAENVSVACTFVEADALAARFGLDLAETETDEHGTRYAWWTRS